MVRLKPDTTTYVRPKPDTTDDLVPGFSLRARKPAGEASTDVEGPALSEVEGRINRDADLLRSHLEDAAHFPGGHSSGIAAPTSEAAVANAIRLSSAVLPIGAQSSLTGGATPFGETLISTARLNRIVSIGVDRARVEPGVTLADFDRALERSGRSYPPIPTFTGAFVGGTVATNAAGASTFRHGTTRDWVTALTIVLASGDVLDIERGATRAHRDGYFELELSEGTIRVPVPTYRMPAVPKLSAGYFASPDMDLIDLFIGSEGTLGIVTAVTLRILPRRPAVCLAFVPFPSSAAALAFASALRKDVAELSAIEHLDARSLQLAREDGLDRACGVRWPADAAMALLVGLELPSDFGSDRAFDELGGVRERGAPDTALSMFSRMLADAGVLDDVEIAVPGDKARALQLAALREGVPAAVNQRVGRAKQRVDSRIEKTAADVIVPFERIGELLQLYDAEFRRRGLDAAIWGHLSDGNLHPNVIPRSFDDVRSGREAMLAFGREAIRLGGAPLAEHGVGRNPVKQQLLRELYGENGIEEMRRVKRALDPQWKLAPGVLFTP
jgi:D-lactate dehydrogenase (cytochrome)